ncbi:hypothetical protein [Streptomyces sp. NPDC097981]|uniref:hypothetical protein n=1 Tax=Streptomyces sp. NPDC097981 TaxID=3155428 RepID=UPI0033210D57
MPAPDATTVWRRHAVGANHRTGRVVVTTGIDDPCEHEHPDPLFVQVDSGTAGGVDHEGVMGGHPHASTCPSGQSWCRRSTARSKGWNTRCPSFSASNAQTTPSSLVLLKGNPHAWPADHLDLLADHTPVGFSDRMDAVTRFLKEGAPLERPVPTES